MINHIFSNNFVFTLNIKHLESIYILVVKINCHSSFEHLNNSFMKYILNSEYRLEIFNLFEIFHNFFFCILCLIEMHLFKNKFMHFLFIQKQTNLSNWNKRKMNVDMIWSLKCKKWWKLRAFRLIRTSVSLAFSFCYTLFIYTSHAPHFSYPISNNMVISN